MNADEARKIAEIVSTADGGCPVCTQSMVVLLGFEFPDQDWPMLVAAEMSFSEDYKRSLAKDFRDALADAHAQRRSSIEGTTGESREELTPAPLERT